MVGRFIFAILLDGAADARGRVSPFTPRKFAQTRSHEKFCTSTAWDQEHLFIENLASKSKHASLDGCAMTRCGCLQILLNPLGPGEKLRPNVDFGVEPSLESC